MIAICIIVAVMATAAILVKRGIVDYYRSAIR